MDGVEFLSNDGYASKRTRRMPGGLCLEKEAEMIIKRLKQLSPIHRVRSASRTRRTPRHSTNSIEERQEIIRGVVDSRKGLLIRLARH